MWQNVVYHGVNSSFVLMLGEGLDLDRVCKMYSQKFWQSVPILFSLYEMP